MAIVSAGTESACSLLTGYPTSQPRYAMPTVNGLATRENLMSNHVYQPLLDALAQRAQGRLSQANVGGEFMIARHLVGWTLTCNGADSAEDMVVCRAHVGWIEPEQAVDAYRMLLQGNNLWAGTQGATLGLCGRYQVIITAAYRAASLDLSRVGDWLVSLARDAQTWSLLLPRATTLLHA